MAIYGRFYFKKTTNGNLIGEYSNNGMDCNQTESADLNIQSESKDHFVGEYKSTWREGNSPILMELTIKFKPGSNEQIFDLEWKRNKKVEFRGQGFLCDNILIGDYTDQKIL
jgi:hypothetical protein